MLTNQEKAGPGSLAFSLVLSFGRCQKKERMTRAGKQVKKTRSR